MPSFKRDKRVDSDEDERESRDPSEREVDEARSEHEIEAIVPRYASRDDYIAAIQIIQAISVGYTHVGLWKQPIVLKEQQILVKGGKLTSCFGKLTSGSSDSP